MAVADTAVVLLELDVQWDRAGTALITCLIQHTSKLNFLFVEKFTVMPFD